MRPRSQDLAGTTVIGLELLGGGPRAIIGIALLALAVSYASIIFWPVAHGKALMLWAACYGLLIAIWMGVAVTGTIRQPDETEARSSWLPLVRTIGTASNLLAALSIWLFLPAASAELRAFMGTLYIWYVVIQIMAESSATSVSASAIILVLGSLAFYELAHPARYSIEMGAFTLLFAASMLSLRRLIRQALMEALAARLEAERANAALDAALADVGAQRDAIRRFLAAASHDLQQPVQAASLFFDRAIAPGDTAPRERAIEGARRAFTAMQTLLQSMLEHLRLDAGVVPLRTESIPLGPFLASVAHDHEPTLRDAGIAIKVVSTKDLVTADAALLRRIVANLLSNVVSHSRASRVLVGVRRRGTRILLHVMDDGRGISLEDAGIIFQEYASIGGASGHFGLGLASARRLAGAMGSELRLEQGWRNGACFILDLPAPDPILNKARA